ncbi:MAG: ABC transporter substrate-binding protein [Desulfurispora sp.]|uniref:ABC transporter substrate-binding protein n=1 Tax=Desulfurispora sp. TaxID=3014275 RepID=UPI004049DD4F
MLKKWFWPALLLLALTLALAGCGGQQAQNAAPAKDITLVYAQGSDPRGLDPAFVDDGESAKVIVNVFEGLVRYKPDSTEVEPCLATEWTSSPDGKEWTFKLRQGVKFHDGTDFNAEAVKFSVERQLPPNRTDDMPYASFTFGPVQKVEVVDQYTVKFILNEPYAPFLANMAMALAAPIVSPAAVQKYGKDFIEHPVGTGPFKFVKWDKGQQIELARNDNYWGDKPAAAKVFFKFTKENSVRASQLKTGEVDMMDGVDPNDVKMLEQSGLKLIKNPGMNINYVGFLCHKPPFNNVKMRQAVSYAINRQNLVDYLYQGLADLANGPLPKFMPGYASDLKPIGYDPEKAKALLKEAGYKGEKITILAYSNPRPYNPVGGEKLAAAIQQDLLKVGINCDIKTYPWKEYKDVLFKAQEGHMFLYGWIGDNGDPDNFLSLFDSKEIAGSLNAAKYSNPQVDKLLAEGRKTMDPAKRAQIYHDLQKIVLEEAPWVYVSHSLDMAAYRPNVVNFNLHPTGVVFLRGVSKN